MDLGSGQGACSLAAAAHGFRVIAFEPLKVNHGALRLSLCANPGMGERVTLFSKVSCSSWAPCYISFMYVCDMGWGLGMHDRLAAAAPCCARCRAGLG